MRIAAIALAASFFFACSSGSDAPPAPRPVVVPPVTPPVIQPVPPPPIPPVPPPSTALSPIAPAVELNPAPGASDARHQRLVGQGFAIEVPLGFERVAHPTAGTAWAGTRPDGMGNPVRIVVWAAVEPATDLQVYADARSAAATAAGGTPRVMDALLFGFRPGVPNRPAKRMTIRTPEQRAMIQMAIVDGRAYSVACEAPSALSDGDCSGIVASLQML